MARAMGYALMLVAACGLGALAAAQEAPAASERAVFQDPEPNPDLPRVLLIGDSISIGYTQAVRDLLEEEAVVYRIPTNGGPTIRGIEQIEEWLRDGDWAVIHFNWGLHDIRRMPTPEGGDTGPWQVDAEAYAANLEALVTRMKETGATLIWATTTPVPEGASNRVAGDEVTVNALAAPIMERHGVLVNDLHAKVLPQLDEYQLPANVHFTDEGSEFLGKHAAEAIRTALVGRAVEAAP